MANHLDLEEQEQLDQLKHFWKQYGNLITWALIATLGTFAAWNLYQRWQISQAAQAAAMYEEVERIVTGGDVTKLDRAFGDMKDRFPTTTVAQQSGLMAAKVYFEAGKADEAKAALSWVADKSSDTSYQAVARLRLAGVLMQSKDFDGAFKQLSNTFPPEFGALVADRKGDIYSLQGKKDEARSEYQKAYSLFDERADYRRLVEIKLNSLGVNPRADKTAPAVEVKK